MDLEMTGLDPTSDVIVEIATLVTDDQLEIVAEGPDLVVHQPPDALAAIDDSATPLNRIAIALIVPVTNETMNTSITAWSPCCSGRFDFAVPYATAAVP